MTEIISVQNEPPPTWEPEPEQAGPAPMTVWMTSFTCYELSSGKIKYTGNCTNEELEIHRSISDVIEGTFDYATHYIADGEALLRPSDVLTTEGNAVADGVTEMKLYGVPDGAVLKCSGVTNFEVAVRYETDQFVTLVFATPGEHVFEVEAFPYLIERIVINAS